MWVVNKDKSIEYLQELVQRDEEMVQKLQALKREVEERADEKLLFIEKLKGNVPLIRGMILKFTTVLNSFSSILC
ncbi:hypothetical protein Tco_0226029 [Tanacetum coccineum]